MPLTRQQLLERRQIVSLPIPELGGDTVCLRPILACERDILGSLGVEGLASITDPIEKAKGVLKGGNFRDHLIAFSLCDEAGNRIFGDDEIKEAGKLAPAVAERIFDKALEVSKLSKVATEELKKN